MFSFSLLVPYRLLLGGVLCSNAPMALAFDGCQGKSHLGTVKLMTFGGCQGKSHLGIVKLMTFDGC